MDIAIGGSSYEQQNLGTLRTSLRALSRILDWLASLFLLSDDEQQQAGIYFRGRRRA